MCTGATARKFAASCHKKTGKPRNTDFVEVSKRHIAASMPKNLKAGTKVKPIHYAGGVIYTVPHSNHFVALCDRHDKWTGVKAAWGKKRTQPEAWKCVTKSIEDFNKSAKKPKK